eukprot:COSAG01_NODE_2568_length_7442_cov_23.918970_6_plen_47_part_00
MEHDDNSPPPTEDQQAIDPSRHEGVKTLSHWGEAQQQKPNEPKKDR